MFDIGFFEILLIGIIALLILGPKRLPGFLTKLEEYVKLIRSKSSSIAFSCHNSYSMKNIVERLSALLKERKNADPSSSYVASLYAKGNEKIIEKIAEETDELIAEITEDPEKNKVIHEAADLWFHVMVLLTNNGIDPTEVLKELESREGLSGIEEKKGRKE